MNQTLETMARALYKSWLVDFDPADKPSNSEGTAGTDLCNQGDAFNQQTSFPRAHQQGTVDREGAGEESE